MVNKMIRKHAHGFILTIATICLGTSQTFAQTANSEISLAVKVLKNIETEKSKEWAVQTLTNAAVNGSSAYAMNCLGLVYMEGIGVDRDSAKAVDWMEKATEDSDSNSQQPNQPVVKFYASSLTVRPTYRP